MDNENKAMVNEKLKKFSNQESNVYKGFVTLYRYDYAGRKLYEVRDYKTDMPICSGISNFRKKISAEKLEELKETQRKAIISEKLDKNAPEKKEELTKVKPKGTGGKPAYAMVMLKNSEILAKLSANAMAIFVIGMLNIEWNTSKLVDKRSKKAITAEDISKDIKVSLRTAKTAIKELTDADIISYNKNTKAYYFNKNILRKGAVYDEN